MDIAKAGWLHRQSTVMHKWKKYWFVLNQSGELRYFEGPDSHTPEEEKLVLRAIVVDVKAGDACDFHPPEGRTKHCLLHLKLRDRSDLRLCAESPDDMKAWQVAIDEARVLPQAPGAPMVGVPPMSQVVYPQMLSSGYSYPGQVIAAPGQYVVHNAAGGGSQTVIMGNTPGPAQVVYMDDPRYHRRHYGNSRYGCYRGGPMFYGPLWW